VNSAIYTPILKSKRGEAKALLHLSPSVKPNIIPFFDVLALKSESLSGSDVQEHMIKQALTMASGWKQQGPCYVDLFDVAPSARGIDGVHPALLVHERLASEQVHVIPVVGLERDLPYKLAIRSVVSNGADALGIRLEAEDIQLPTGLAIRVRQLIQEIGARSIPVHLFLDFRSIANQPSDIIQVQFSKALAELRSLGVARIVFAASAMVNNMGGFKKDSFNRVPRLDYLTWRALASIHSDVDFADYGVVHPDYIDLDPRFIKPAAKIRYATDREWLIVKGSRWVSDTSQHHGLSRVLCSNPEFRGADCWGSDYISTAASGRKSYGALETWVTIDQNTHITHTVSQLTKVVAARLASV
jgi:hypothetical protein